MDSIFLCICKKIELSFKSCTMNHILKNKFSFFLVQDMEQTNHSSALLNIGGVMYKYKNHPLKAMAQVRFEKKQT